VKTVFDRNKGFDFAKFSANLKQIFTPVFPSMNVELLVANDSRLAPWKQTGTQTHSATIKNAMGPLVDEGHLIPFFQFWVSAAKPEDLPSPPAEPDALGLAETLAAPSHYFSADKRQKRIQQPAHLLTPAFTDTYRKATGDQANTFAANVIAHEVGHGLGLVHIKRADQNFDVAAGTGLMANQIQPDPANPPLVVKRLRAVHQAVLLHHYG
jgi:hypothetical protein